MADGGAFRSLRIYNYRVWASGAIVSNVGTWMQRIGQDWLVLTQLTHNNATSVGIVMSLQFGPQLLLLPVTGYAADHFNRRKLLYATQAAMGLLALGLGILTLSGHVRLWHVYGFAGLLGAVAAFDAPARQAFVSDIVGEADLPNAVGLNSTSFNAARMIGPAVAGLLIAQVGEGWLFIINAVSFGAVIASLTLMRTAELRPRAKLTRGKLTDGFRYVATRRDLQIALLMLFIIGTFGLNFPIYISTMSVTVFKAGSKEYGLLTSTMAIGSVIGALMSARRERPTWAIMITGSLVFGIGCAVAAMMPDYRLFGVVLVAIGAFGQTFTVSANSMVQITTAPEMRGRVLAILMAIFAGGTPIGAPIVGKVADAFGPRWGMGVGAAAGVLAAAVGAWYWSMARRSEPTTGTSPTQTAVIRDGDQRELR
jgi:MFS family permease